MFNSSLLTALPVYNPTSDIALLLHMNGANGSSSFVDSSQNNFTVTATGTPVMSTAQSKFGEASAYFKTQNNSQIPRDQLSIPSNSVFDFGYKDFTIEAFVYFPEGIVTNSWTIIEKGYSGGTGFGIFMVNCVNTSGGDRLYFYASSNASSSWDIAGGLTIAGNFSLNTWHHLAIVRYGTTWKAFWNGVQSFAITSALPLFTSASPINIRKPSAISASAIYIDEIRIINGRAEYIDNFTPPTSQFPDNFSDPPPSISITTPISGNNAVDGNEEYLPLIISGVSSGANSRIAKITVGELMSRVTTAANGSWSLTLTPSQIQSIEAGSVAVVAEVSSAIGKPAQPAVASFSLSKSVDQYFAYVSLLLHLNGDNNSTSFVDNSKNAFAITRTGDTKIVTSESKFNGSCAFFDGNGDWLSVADNAAFQFDTGNFTIEGWFNVASYTTQYPAIIGNGNSSYGGSGNTGSVVISVVGSPRKLIYATNTTNPIVQSTTTILPGQWYHFAIVRVGTTVYLFLNGVLESTATNSQAVNFSNNGLQIGRTGWDGSNGYWNGYLAELRITRLVPRYTSTFTPPNAAYPNTQAVDAYFPIASLLLHGDGANNSTSIFDSSSNLLPVSRGGSVCIKTNQSKFDGSSIFFNGNADYLTVAASAIHYYPGDFTIELWMYQSVYKQSVIVSSTSSSQNNIQIFKVNVGFSGSVSIYMDNNEASLGNLIATDSQVFYINTWNHFAFTRKKGVGRLFVNGILCGTKENWFTGFRADAIGSLFTSGTRFASLDYEGWIDEARFTNGFSRYNSNFSVPTDRFFNP